MPQATEEKKKLKVETIIPHGTKLLVREQELESKTPGGIVLPDRAQKSLNLETRRGEVVYVGPGWRHEKDGYTMPLPWEVGDVVVYYLGRMSCPLKIGGEELVVLDEMDVLGVIVEEDESHDERSAMQRYVDDHPELSASVARRQFTQQHGGAVASEDE